MAKTRTLLWTHVSYDVPGWPITIGVRIDDDEEGTSNVRETVVDMPEFQATNLDVVLGWCSSAERPVDVPNAP